MTECAAPRGSQRWLQLVVNRCPKLIDNAIGEALGLGQDETIEWLSPLESDCFREYQDQAFLDRLCIRPRHRHLQDFWPNRGPVWDGLAKTSGGRRLLIEAKANIPEFNSSPTAASEESLSPNQGGAERNQVLPWSQIRDGLDEMLLPVRQQAGAPLFPETGKQDRCRLSVRLLCRRQDCVREGACFEGRLGGYHKSGDPPSRHSNELAVDTR